jgi:hypothetical protein
VAKTRITSVLLPSGWSAVSDCSVSEGLWTCRLGPYQQVVIKEAHIYGWKQSEIEETPAAAHGLGVFE